MTVPSKSLLTGSDITKQVKFWDHGQITGDECWQAHQMVELADRWPRAVVVVEDFILRKFTKGRELLFPVRITEAFRYALWLRQREMFKQMPSEAKTIATDDRLKMWGLYEREGGMQHARDADRHAISWLRKCKERPELRAKSWPYLYSSKGFYAQEGAEQLKKHFGGKSVVALSLDD